MYGSYKEFQQANYPLKNVTLHATAIYWYFLTLSKLYLSGFFQSSFHCFIQQDNALPTQSRKRKKVSQSGMSMIIQNFFLTV